MANGETITYNKVSTILKCNWSYNIKKLHERFKKNMYMDDIKIYAKNQKKTRSPYIFKYENRKIVFRLFILK